MNESTLNRRRMCRLLAGAPAALALGAKAEDGEAEEPFAQFLELARLRGSKDFAPHIPGLAYRYGRRTWVNTLPADGYGRSAIATGGTTVDEVCFGVHVRPLEGPPLSSQTTLPVELPRRHNREQEAGAKSRDSSSGRGMQVDRPRSTRRQLENLVRPAPRAEVIATNPLDFCLLHGFEQAVDSLFFTGGRGCPGVCTFCSRLHGGRLRVKGARQLLDEIAAADAAVAAGRLQVGRWPLFRWAEGSPWTDRLVAWAAVYDEDFFLSVPRALEFFALWSESPLRHRYRLSVQTNPCSLLASDGRVHTELLSWIDRLKPMVQLGAESFHPELLARWNKRHGVAQLETVLDALDRTRQDYTVFQLLSDYESTPGEVLDAVWLLVRAGFRHRRMRIASSPFTIPLYDSDTRRVLEFSGRLSSEHISDFTDFERPHPEWMDPLAAELADLADAELRYALEPEHRDAALFEALAVLDCRLASLPDSSRNEELRARSRWALNDAREARFG